MCKISLLYLLTALAVWGQTGDSGRSTRKIMSGSASLSEKVSVRYKSVLSWATSATSDPGRGLGAGGVAVGGEHGSNTIHRVMTDKIKAIYFGYDLTVGPGDPSNGYLVTFAPVTRPEVLLNQVGGSPFTMVQLPRYPAPQVVHLGDTIVLDLMASADGTAKLTDFLEFYEREPEPAAAKTPADQARDFTIDDGPVKFDSRSLTIWNQGQQMRDGWTFWPKDGATFWIAFPGQGRYLLSLSPHEGMVKAGTIRDNVISFEADGQEYEVRFLSAIAGDGKAWNLYMLHDPAYQVADKTMRKSIALGTGRLVDLLPK